MKASTLYNLDRTIQGDIDNPLTYRLVREQAALQQRLYLSTVFFTTGGAGNFRLYAEVPANSQHAIFIIGQYLTVPADITFFGTQHFMPTSGIPPSPSNPFRQPRLYFDTGGLVTDTEFSARWDVSVTPLGGGTVMFDFPIRFGRYYHDFCVYRLLPGQSFGRNVNFTAGAAQASIEMIYIKEPL